MKFALAAVMVVTFAAGCGGASDRQDGPPLMGAVSVSVGAGHACAVLGGGTATCWGDNAFGQLGNGETGIPHLAPTMVQGLTNTQAITAARSHTCALIADGSVSCWGNNGSCQIGDCSSWEPSLLPTTVPGLSGPTVAIQANAFLGDSAGFTCALLADGRIVCWGEDLFGLGDDHAVAGIPPTPIPGVTGATAMAIADIFGCDVLSSGTVECWGLVPLGQPGNSARTASMTPVPVPALSDVRALAAGWFHVCALLGDGTVACWGSNSSGQLGDGTRIDSPIPVKAVGITTAVAISTTASATCAVLKDGSLWCWGIDLTRLTPRRVPGVSTATSVSVGDRSICAVVSGGEIRCWGNDEYGQLGDGSHTGKGDLTSAPVTVVTGR